MTIWGEWLVSLGLLARRLLKNAKGNEHNASGVNSLPDSLKSGKLATGEKVRGTVAFRAGRNRLGSQL